MAALTICTEAETVGETVATSSPLDAAAAAASINKSINNCESCSQCSQPAYPHPFSPLSFLFFVQLSLAVRPSFIRIFQLTFKRRVFPLRESGPQLSDGRQPASQPGRNGLLLMAPSGPFLRLSITITFCQLRRRRNAKSQTVATAPGPQQQQQQQTLSEATKVPPTRVAREKKRQWNWKRLKPYWYLLCIFVYSINTEVLGKSEQNPFVCS